MYDQLHTICAIVVVLTSMLGVCTNTTILVAFYKMSKKLRNKTSNFLLMNQACADISTVVPAILNSVCIYYWIVENRDLQTLNSVLLFLFFLADPTSITSLALNVAHGASSIKASQSNIFSKRNTVAAVVIVWIFFCTVGIFPAVYANDFTVWYHFIVGYNIYVFVVIAVIVALLMVNCKSHPSLSCGRFFKTSSAVPYDEMIENTTCTHKQQRLLKSMILRCIVLVTTDLPHAVLWAVVLHGEMNEQLYHASHWLSLSYLLSTLHPILNSLVTIFLVEDFKLARKWLTFGKCGTMSTIENDSEDENDCSIVVDDL